MKNKKWNMKNETCTKLQTHPEGEYFGEKIKEFFSLLNPFEKKYKRYTKSK